MKVSLCFNLNRFSRSSYRASLTSRPWTEQSVVISSLKQDLTYSEDLNTLPLSGHHCRLASASACHMLDTLGVVLPKAFVDHSFKIKISEDFLKNISLHSKRERDSKHQGNQMNREAYRRGKRTNRHERKTERKGNQKEQIIGADETAKNQRPSTNKHQNRAEANDMKNGEGSSVGGSDTRKFLGNHSGSLRFGLSKSLQTPITCPRLAPNKPDRQPNKGHTPNDPMPGHEP